MRRKLFFCALFAVAFTGIFIRVFDDGKSDLNVENSMKYEGKVVSIENDNDGTKLVVEIKQGQRALISYYGENKIGQDLYGSIISFETVLAIPKSQTNPRCFDYRLYLKSIEIDYIGTIKSLKEIKKATGLYHKYCKYLLTQKERFLNSIDDEDTKAFVDGILFGNISSLDENTYNEFKANGTAHILAVSGLHIGIIYELIQKMMGKGQGLFNIALTVFSMWSLGILTGWTPSVIRAIGLIFFKTYALNFDKRYDPLSAISLIAILMIIQNPYVVFNVSFQMSFLAVSSIIFINPHIPSKIPDFLAVIIAVNIGLAPYQAFQFNTFSITSFLANIPVVYLAGILLPITFVQFVIFLLTGFDIFLIEYVVNAVSKLLITTNKFCTFGLGNIDVKSPSLFIIILFYLAGGFIISETFCILWIRKKAKVICSILLMILVFGIASSMTLVSPFDDAEVVFVDVGQGACVHIKNGDKNILIDGGGKSDYQVGRKIVKPYLLKNRIGKVDLAIATHKHTDHYQGLKELREDSIIDKIEDGLWAGKLFKISDQVYLETLWPLTNEEAKNQEENKNCSVFMLYYMGKKVLITGDLDSDGESKMVEAYKNTGKLKADILAAGHHGSQYSTSKVFLEEVNPQYCVIQVGKNNYGHPHTKTIENLEEKCIIILRNDIHGAIGFSLDEANIGYVTMS